MRKEVFAGVVFAFIGLGVAAPAKADPWEVCVIGACLQASCTPPEGTVMVTMPVDLADRAVGNSNQIKNQLSLKVLERGMPSQSQNNCVGPFPTEAAAAEKSLAIYQNMRNSFSDVSMLRPAELFPDYGQSSSAAASNDSSDDSSGALSASESESNDDDDAATAAAAEAERQAQAQRDRELADQRARDAEAARQAEQRRRELAQADADAQAQRDRERRQKEMAELEAKNSNDDANQCVSGATLKLNDTFQGNTAAYVTNGCGRPVDVRICLMTEEKGWNCGMTYGLSSQSSWSWSSMKATGSVFQDARISGSNRTMRSP